ncbi:HAD family hydrolase [Streptacidiphilus rugosus]|uniref:HAD family hydrolase n=1 Tax=Streptacidiphilus rugosus TaxID=405783 RepID=UPI00069014A4|nr:HAD family phosphatase [Streptacidiphilus rugosus]
MLLDFDGPVCNLFARRPAPGVARVLLDELRGQGVAWLQETDDPHGLLARLPALLDAARTPSAEAARLIALTDRALAREELLAAVSADPTPGAREGVLALAKAGVPLAVVSNNARPAIEEYLLGAGLVEALAKHVVGRPADLARMKPDPSGIQEALHALGVAGEAVSRCVYVGDAVGDASAARAAGVRFLGWAGGLSRRSERLLGVGVPQASLFDEWSHLTHRLLVSRQGNGAHI